MNCLICFGTFSILIHKFLMAVASNNRILSFGYGIYPPYTMPCMVHYHLDETCKHPGIIVELLAHMLAPCGLQPRFAIIDASSHDKVKSALTNQSIDASILPLHEVNSNLSVSIFPFISERPTFVIRKPIAEEVPKFLIITTFNFEIWVCAAITGVVLLTTQRFVQRALNYNSRLAVATWWLVLGVLL